LGGNLTIRFTASDGTTGSTGVSDAGGYGVKLAPGHWTLTLSGGPLLHPQTIGVDVGTSNVKVDFVVSDAPAAAGMPTINVDQSLLTPTINGQQVTGIPLLLDGKPFTPGLQPTLTPGEHKLNTSDSGITIEVDANGKLSVPDADSKIAEISPDGKTLTVHGATVTLAASSQLSIQTLLVDRTFSITAGSSVPLTLLPGIHKLQDSTFLGGAFFSITSDGKFSLAAYSPTDAQALQKASIFSGVGTKTLTVNGAAVAIDASPLSTGPATLDRTLSDPKNMFSSLRLLPGTHVIQGYPGSEGVFFTVDANGTFSLQANTPQDAAALTQANIFSGLGMAKLTVNGAAVKIDASRLSTGPVIIDRMLRDPQNMFSLRLLPGTHFIQGYPGSYGVFFTVEDNGTFSLRANTPQDALALTQYNIFTIAPDGKTLTVNGAAVTFDVTALRNRGIQNFTVSGSSFSTQPGLVTLQLLPVYYSFQAGGQVAFNFSLDYQDQVAVDPVFDNLVTVSGKNTLTLL
jgi:hypothetical protein